MGDAGAEPCAGKGVDEMSMALTTVALEDLGDDTGVLYVITEVGMATPVKVGSHSCGLCHC